LRVFAKKRAPVVWWPRFPNETTKQPPRQTSPTTKDTPMKLIKIAIAFAIALSVAVPAAAFACGPYGPPTERQLITWAVHRDANQRTQNATVLRRVKKLDIKGDRAVAVIYEGVGTRMKKWNRNHPITVRELQVTLHKTDGKWKVSRSVAITFAWSTTVDGFYKIGMKRTAKL
jgi:hypothetical protein